MGFAAGTIAIVAFSMEAQTNSIQSQLLCKLVYCAA